MLEYVRMFFYRSTRGKPGQNCPEWFVLQNCPEWHPPSPLYPIMGIESNGSVPNPDSSKHEVLYLVPSSKSIEILRVWVQSSWEVAMDPMSPVLQ